MKPSTSDMEIAVAKLIGWRKHVIIPNVSWGLFLKHEADLLVLDQKNRFTEIEIKISKADLKADFKKKHDHSSPIISRLIYAVPDFLVEDAKNLIPNQCGLISVRYHEYTKKFIASWVKTCRHDKYSKKVEPKTIIKFLNLGCMRIWKLKIKLQSK